MLKIFHADLFPILDCLGVKNIIRFSQRLANDHFKYTNLEDADCIFVTVPIRYTLPICKFNHILAETISKSNKPIFLIMVNECHKTLQPREPLNDHHRQFMKFVYDSKFGNNLKAILKSNLYSVAYDDCPIGVKLHAYELLPEHRFNNIHHANMFIEEHNNEQYNSRPIDIFISGHLENIPSRKLIRDELISRFKSSGRLITRSEQLQMIGKKKNLIVILDSFKNKRNRLPIARIMRINQQSKISISVEGTNPKCMRHLECSRNSLMAKDQMDVVWTYPWIDKKNCLLLPYKNSIVQPKESVDYMLESLKSDKLYNIYKACIENNKNYRIPTFYKKYLYPLIKSYL